MQVNPGCGHVGHDVDCLCDVEVKRRAPSPHTPFESAMGAAVARALGVDLVDHRRDELLMALGVTVEMYERFHRDGWHGLGDDSHALRRRRIRSYLHDGGLLEPCYLDDDHCERNMAMNWAEVLTTLAKKSRADRPSRLFMWDGLDWFRLDTAALEGERATRSLAVELRISTSTLANLLALYDGRYAKH